MYTKSLDIKTRIYGGDNHLDVAASYNNIGTVYESLGKYEEALEMYTKSLDIMTRILGGDNPPRCSGEQVQYSLFERDSGRCGRGAQAISRVRTDLCQGVWRRS